MFSVRDKRPALTLIGVTPYTRQDLLPTLFDFFFFSTVNLGGISEFARTILGAMPWGSHALVSSLAARGIVRAAGSPGSVDHCVCLCWLPARA